MKIFKRIITLITTLVLVVLSSSLFSSCKKEENRFVENDIVYKVVLSDSKVLENISLKLILDEKNSTITLRKDGTASILLKTKKIDSLLNLVLANADLSTFDISPYEDMAKEFLPGFSIGDMETGLKMLKNNVGVAINGFDFTDHDTVELFKQFNETKRLPANAKFPEYLSIEYNANYYLKDVYSETKGNMRGVYMGKHEENGEPYIVMTQSLDKDGIETIEYFNIMLKTYIVAKAA